MLMIISTSNVNTIIRQYGLDLINPRLKDSQYVVTELY